VPTAVELEKLDAAVKSVPNPSSVFAVPV